MLTLFARSRIRFPLALSLLFVGSASAGPTLLGIERSPAGTTLFNVDPITGKATNPRLVQDDSLGGIAYSSADILYGIGTGLENYGRLYSVDVSSGASDPIGEATYGYVLQAGLAFDPATGLLWCIEQIRPGSSTALGVYSIDPVAGTLYAGASFAHLSDDPTGIAIDNLGQLYVLAAGVNELWQVDPATGAKLAVTPIASAVAGLAGLEFDSETGMFYVGQEAASNSRLYQLDPTHGTLTDIGPTGTSSGIVGLAYLPEPTTFLLVLLCGLNIARRRGPRKLGRIPLYQEI